MTKKHTIHRIGSLLTGALMCASLAACGNTAPAASSAVAVSASSSVSTAPAPEATPASAPVAMKKAPGGDVENSVFFIAVKDSANAETKHYYYTKEELIALETTHAYSYNDHSVDKTATCKGAMLNTLIEGLDGVNITGDLVVQYAEEDGYHADANTDVLNSDYKDTVDSLSKPILAADGSTKNPRSPIVTYLIHEEYAKPDEFNKNDAEGVFKDADDNSGFLRIYRDTGAANHTVLKYIVGVVISPDGSLLSGKDGCTVKAVSDKNATLSVAKDHVIQGLLPGMSYAVKAPDVDTAKLAEGETAVQVVTVGEGAESIATFKYTENVYFSVKNGDKTTGYTFTDMQKMGVQVPSKDGNTAPYGYVRPMYYRYNGIFLNELLKDVATEGKIVRLTAADGTKLDIEAAKLGEYFVAYEETCSKSSTNIPEGKRKTKGYVNAQVILPASAENITGSAQEDYTEKGSPVTVAMKDAVSVEVVSA